MAVTGDSSSESCCGLARFPGGKDATSTRAEIRTVGQSYADQPAQECILVQGASLHGSVHVLHLHDSCKDSSRSWIVLLAFSCTLVTFALVLGLMNLPLLCGCRKGNEPEE